MTVLYGNGALPILVFELENGTPVFWKKRFRLPENLFQSLSIENVQNFHWLSHKNMPIQARN